MRCPRCGERSSGASWYCASCGAALSDLNVADSVGRQRVPRVLRIALVVTLSALALAVAAVALDRRGLLDDVVPALAPDRRPAALAPRATPVASPSSPPSSPPSSQLSQQRRATTTAVEMAATGTPTAAARHTPTVLPPFPTPTRATPVVQPTTAVRTRSGIPRWSLTQRASPPTLDGWLDDWTGQPIEIAAVIFGREFWDGASDLSARAFGGWDSAALYLGVNVLDDRFSQPSSGTDLYLGDSLELQIDTDLAGDWATDVYNSDDWQLGLSPGDFGERAPEAFIWRPEAQTAAEVDIGARRTEDGYILEAAIPWALLNLDGPPRTGALGLALNISDNDVAAPAQLTLISSSSVRQWGDPRTFNTAVLVNRTR